MRAVGALVAFRCQQSRSVRLLVAEAEDWLVELMFLFVRLETDPQAVLDEFLYLDFVQPEGCLR